jgi:hypothetical protein
MPGVTPTRSIAVMADVALLGEPLNASILVSSH